MLRVEFKDLPGRYYGPAKDLKVLDVVEGNDAESASMSFGF